MKLSVLTPERRLVENIEVQELTLSTFEGQVQVLPGHADFIGVLGTGPFSYKKANGEELRGVISTGFFEVKAERVNVLAETLELSGEIDVDRARRAQKKAEDMLNGAALDEAAFKKYQLKLERSLVRQASVKA